MQACSKTASIKLTHDCRNHRRRFRDALPRIARTPTPSSSPPSLNLLGVSVAFKTIVGDNLQHLTSAANIAIRRTDIVIFSGGLGPTEDDLTREAVAAALGLTMHRDPETLASLEARFPPATSPCRPTTRSRPTSSTAPPSSPTKPAAPPANGSTQQSRPRASPTARSSSSSPARHPNSSRCSSTSASPASAATLPPRHIATRLLRMALIPESTVDARTSPIYKTFHRRRNHHPRRLRRNPAPLLLRQTHTRRRPSPRRRPRRTHRRAKWATTSSPPKATSLEEVVQLMLGLRDLTLSVAESCTGGLLSERLTAIPNISRNFIGGAVVYSDALKTEFADVSPNLLNNTEPSAPKPPAPSPKASASRTDKLHRHRHHRPRRPRRRPRHRPRRRQTRRPRLHRPLRRRRHAGQTTPTPRRPRPHPLLGLPARLRNAPPPPHLTSATPHHELSHLDRSIALSAMRSGETSSCRCI